MSRQDFAETLALRALAWLAGRDDLWPLYLGASGVEAAALKSRATDPEVLAGILDFVLSEDAWVLGFAEASGVAPQEVAAARRALPGGAVPDWT